MGAFSGRPTARESNDVENPPETENGDYPNDETRKDHREHERLRFLGNRVERRMTTRDTLMSQGGIMPSFLRVVVGIEPTMNTLQFVTVCFAVLATPAIVIHE